MSERDTSLPDVHYQAERPAGEGKPPRPATEPKGAEHSTRTRKTATDPATGEPTGGPGRKR